MRDSASKSPIRSGARRVEADRRRARDGRIHDAGRRASRFDRSKVLFLTLNRVQELDRSSVRVDHVLVGRVLLVETAEGQDLVASDVDDRTNERRIIRLEKRQLVPAPKAR